MKHGKQIAQRFKEVHLDGKWIAHTNYRDLLDDITWEQAGKKIGTLNTIAALTFHVNYYIAGIVKVFAGGPLDIRDKYSFDFPGVHSETDWDNLRNEFYANAEAFAEHLAAMSDEQLDQPFIDPKYGDYRRNIEGMIEHGYYHLGQISLLKKMINF